ncbi:hypothetical protein TrCOL_g10715 [Triparma columacea]|uniref:Rab-GAP TBC domain-containing protein n=1 Tax=Triparma columacea TaxID=722753 RepID=A0A9W7LDI4_9STRA|nr:hypothetical protein TrCOL_g10715 [Triparma columacea]
MSRSVSSIIPLRNTQTALDTTQMSRQERENTPIDLNLLALSVTKGGLSTMTGNEGNLRPITWLLLSGILPPTPSSWSASVSKMNSDYWGWVDELLESEEWWDEETWVEDGCFDSNRGDFGDDVSKSSSTAPASTSPSSSPPSPPSPLPPPPPSKTPLPPSSMLRAPTTPSQCLATEIHKDVLRTHPTISFFITPPSSRWRLSSLMRVLFVWAKLNGGVKYVQGMNEIAGVVAFVLGREDNWIQESLTYYLTSHLLNLHLDLFTPSLDNAFTGLSSSIEKVTDGLERHDPIVYRHLEALNIEGAFYLMRWVTTLLSREFNMPDTVRIWDVFFTNNQITPYVCVAMVCLVRDEILTKDFGGCLELLQNYPMSVDVEQVVAGAKGLWVLERRVTECRDKTGWGVRECLAAVGEVKGVVMGYGWRGGIPDGDLGETIKLVGGQIKLGAREVAKDMGSVARSVGRGLLSWGKNVAKNMEESMDKASEIRKEKDRERNARMVMERMREERRRAEFERERREGFLEQQKEFMETELKNNVEGTDGGKGGRQEGGAKEKLDTETNDTIGHNPFK